MAMLHWIPVSAIVALLSEILQSGIQCDKFENHNCWCNLIKTTTHLSCNGPAQVSQPAEVSHVMHLRRTQNTRHTVNGILAAYSLEG